MIWIKVFIKNHEPIIVCSAYRQWSLPAILELKNSKDIKSQRARFKTYLDGIRRALNLKLVTIVLHDVNIDISPNNNHNSQFNIKSIFDTYNCFLNDNDLSILNSKFTRYAPHQNPSTIDHLITNRPSLFSDVTTITNCISDHCTLMVNFKIKAEIYWPRFKFNRNLKKLTSDSLKLAVAKNHKIQNLMRYDDPNYVAETLNNELNFIIDELAPRRRIVNNKKFQPFYNNEIRDQMAEVDRLLTVAIKSKKQDDWRLRNHQRNLLYKNIEVAKSKYLAEKLNDKKRGWDEIKNFNGLNKAVLPCKIMNEGKVITSPKDIANVANSHFITKIEKLNAAMSSETRDPVALLRKLIPRRSESLFELKLISLKETYTLIKQSKNSGSTGFDSISNKII